MQAGQKDRHQRWLAGPDLANYMVGMPRGNITIKSLLMIDFDPVKTDKNGIYCIEHTG